MAHSVFRHSIFIVVHFFALLLIAGVACADSSALRASDKRAVKVISSYVDPKNIGYSRRAYENAVIELLLAKTGGDDFHLQQADFKSNSARELRIMQEHPEINFIRTFAVNNDLIKDKKLRYIEFPIMRGALSYRICLTTKPTQQILLAIDNLEEFKQFTHVQGLGWLDTKILRHSGFTVVEAGAYSALVALVARKRADLLCRGVNEVQSDWFDFNRDMSSLVIDEKHLIFYPLPRYFFTHVKNKALLKRMEKGLKIARADGSFIHLWQQHHLSGLQKAHLATRNLFVLENPFIDKIKPNYREYFYTIDQNFSTKPALEFKESTGQLPRLN